MRRFLHFTTILALAALAAGCASTKSYFTDRGRDAADILTLTMGTGAGVKARIGPIQVGALYAYDAFGLRGGRLAWWWSDQADGEVVDIDYLVLPLFGFGYETLDHQALRSPARHKDFMTDKPLPILSLPLTTGGYSEWDVSRTGFHYFTQFEVVVALGPSIRLGLNPGELLDFLLGWTTLDIYKDDVALNALKNPAPAEPNTAGAQTP